MGARFSAPVQTGPRAHPASCTMGTGSFSGIKSCRGVTLTPHPFLVPWSRKSRAIPLLPLWAVRPVQSLSTCTRVHFTTLYIPLISSSLTNQHSRLASGEVCKLRSFSFCSFVHLSFAFSLIDPNIILGTLLYITAN